MEIRPYRSRDCGQILRLFYETVRTVNARDYSPEQLAVWATGREDPSQWDRSLSAHQTLVAWEGERILGFADLDAAEGYLDRLYVHKDYQRQGIATALCDQLEALVTDKPVTTYASITAKPFFQRRGYRVVRRHQVERGGILLTNFFMEKPVNHP